MNCSLSLSQISVIYLSLRYKPYFFFIHLSPVILILTKRPYHITLIYPPLPYLYASTLYQFFTLTAMKILYPAIPLSFFTTLPAGTGLFSKPPITKLSP